MDRLEDARAKLEESARRLRNLQREAERELARARVEAALGQLDRFREAMCACTDAACAGNVSNEMDAWFKSMGEADEKVAENMSEADKQKGMALAEEMGKCMFRATGGAGPPSR